MSKWTKPNPKNAKYVWALLFANFIFWSLVLIIK